MVTGSYMVVTPCFPQTEVMRHHVSRNYAFAWTNYRNDVTAPSSRQASREPERADRAAAVGGGGGNARPRQAELVMHMDMENWRWR